MKNILQKLDLNEKEANVYLALLQLGEDTVFNISKKAGIKRPTCYLVLDELAEKGLVAKNKKQNTTLFSPVDPKQLLEMVKQKESSLKQIIPELSALYNKIPQKPKVQIFEGVQGLEYVYNLAIDSIKKKKEVLFFASLEATNDLTKNAFDYYKKILQENQESKGREILNDTELEREYQKELKKLNSNYKVKFIPKELGQIHSDTIISGDKVILISYNKDIFATVIESQEIANSFKIIYEMAWKNANV
jgi:HTH-type transcriptional regulator, sugar sensing transcriptional regulator